MRKRGEEKESVYQEEKKAANRVGIYYNCGVPWLLLFLKRKSNSITMNISYISHVDTNLDMLTKVTLNHTV